MHHRPTLRCALATLRRSVRPGLVLAALVVPVALWAPLGGCSSSDSAPRCDATHETPDTFDPTLAATLQGIVEAELAASSAPGATLTVRVPGQGSFAGAAGSRDVASGLAMEPRTRFRVGSITKTFVAATFLRLVAEGAVALSDHPADLLADLELELEPTLTFEQLLSHLGGLFNYTDDVAFLEFSTEEWEPAEIVAWSLTHPAVGEPGERYLYSNTGFFVLGLAIEQLTGRPLHEELRRRLLEPLALHDTSEEQHEGRDCAMSEGYVVSGAAATDDIDMSWTWAAGGLVSSGVDLCEWLDALYLGGVLDPATRAALAVPSAASVAAGEPYGYATQVTTRGARRVVGHTGSTMGFRGEAFIDLESGVCVSVLLNDFVSTPRAISEPAWEAVVDALEL